MKISILYLKQEETTIFLELEHSGRTLVSANQLRMRYTKVDHVISAVNKFSSPLYKAELNEADTIFAVKTSLLN